MAEVVYIPVQCGFTGEYGILARETESLACAMACPFTTDKDLIDAIIARLEKERVPLEEFESAFLQGTLLL